MEFIFGAITENMKVNGRIIKCMEKGHLPGLMGNLILVNMQRIKKMDTVNSFGQMEKFTRANGEMENNMEKERYLI
jgi:hypothetical protein